MDMTLEEEMAAIALLGKAVKDWKPVDDDEGQQWMEADEEDEIDVEKNVDGEYDLEGDIDITKADEKKGLVFGWASVMKKNGKIVVDRQKDFIDDDWEMEKAAYNFVMSSRVGGEEHVRKGVSTLIESMAFTDEKIEKMGLPDDFPRGWWVGFKITDKDVMKGMKEGRYTGFSVHGKGKRTEADINKAKDEMTANDVREMISNALRKLYPSTPGTYRYVYVVDHTSSWVIYCVDGPNGATQYLKSDWSCDKDGICTIGTPVEVKSKTTYVAKRYNPDRVADVLSRAKSAVERKPR